MMGKELKIIGASGYTHEDITRIVNHIEKKKHPSQQWSRKSIN